MKKNRYGGSIIWSGASALTLPKQPETRRLVWLAVIANMDGNTVRVGCNLKIKDGSLDVTRNYVCAALLTDSETFDTMFFFSEDVGNDSVVTLGGNAQATCSLGRDAYCDSSSQLTLSLDATPAAGNALVTYVFEDVEDTD